MGFLITACICPSGRTPSQTYLPRHFAEAPVKVEKYLTRDQPSKFADADVEKSIVRRGVHA